jgi:hypothetical protein
MKTASKATLRRISMYFGLLVSLLPRQQHSPFFHSDAGLARHGASVAPPLPATWLAAGWRRLIARVSAA